MIPVAVTQLFIPANERIAGMIDTTIQQEKFELHHTAFFSAQLIVDTDGLKFFEEPWSPEHIPHQKHYDNPVFGNTQESDMERFRARGYGRLVGRAAYTAFSRWSKLDCVERPDLLTELSVSYLSWVWLWKRRKGKACADLAKDNFEAGSTKFVGWPDRLHERCATYQRNLQHMRSKEHDSATAGYA